jgi:hypothetical protein
MKEDDEVKRNSPKRQRERMERGREKKEWTVKIQVFFLF